MPSSQETDRTAAPFGADIALIIHWALNNEGDLSPHFQAGSPFFPSPVDDRRMLKVYSMRTKKLCAAVFCLAAALVFGPAQAAAQGSASLQAVDSLGTVVSLPKPASRVVSLSPASTEALFAVGANVVGVTTYCLYPPEALKAAKIGGFSADSMSIEKILSLKPDLVVSAGSFHKGVTDELARYGIRSFVYGPGDFAGIEKGILALGLLTGNAKKAEAVVSAMSASIRAVRDKVAAIPENKRLSVFWEIYDDPIMTCGASTFQHEIVEAAGGKDIFSDIQKAWPVVSSEEVIRRAPQVIMGADDHGDRLTQSSIAARPGWNLIPAVKTGRIILLPNAPVSIPGPRVAEGVLLAAKALYPELFR